MAMLCSCKVNLSTPSKPAPSQPPSLRTKKTLLQKVPCARNEKSWRIQLVMGMACIIVGVQTGDLNGQNDAVAGILAVAEQTNVQKWSDKRACPPWKINSLETIVPENLPRPSARRRFESVDHSKTTTSPSIAKSLVTPINSKCFSM
ncbi:hypothetical protein RJ641_022265 [Dillenia turbinata]|uniref:Uncharacterized protein n=1 Tax=Dillenia turbinata TaxID=194707 RepID=A0AAN8UH60_9MAGN